MPYLLGIHTSCIQIVIRMCLFCSYRKRLEKCTLPYTQTNWWLSGQNLIRTLRNRCSEPTVWYPAVPIWPYFQSFTKKKQETLYFLDLLLWLLEGSFRYSHQKGPPPYYTEACFLLRNMLFITNRGELLQVLISRGGEFLSPVLVQLVPGRLQFFIPNMSMFLKWQ